jgi:acyl carrier protein
MTRNEIFENVERVFRDVLENEDLIIKESYNAYDVDEWDSLTHIMLVVEIEKRLDISFLSSEITEWKNIGEMISCIESKK